MNAKKAKQALNNPLAGLITSYKILQHLHESFGPIDFKNFTFLLLKSNYISLTLK